MPERPISLHEEGSDDTERAMAERATLLYWNSDRSVNSIADDLGLSKGRLYELVRPIATGEQCPRCQSDLVFENRTARDRDEAVCLECAGDEAADPLPAPVSNATPNPRGLMVGLLVGAAAGLLIGRFLRG